MHVHPDRTVRSRAIENSKMSSNVRDASYGTGPLRKQMVYVQYQPKAGLEAATGCYPESGTAEYRGS